MDSTLPGPARTLLQLRVGAFVIAALVVFVGLVYFLGRQAGLFERQYRLVAGFTQIGGLIEGATVRLAGVPVGRVTAIRLPESDVGKVQVELTLVRRVQSRIRADSVARIETLGLLGDKIVEVSLGGPGAPMLDAGALLQTEEPLDTNRLAKQGAELLRSLVDVSGELRTAVTHVGQTMTRLDRVLADAETTKLVGQAGLAVTEAREAAERVARVVRRVEDGPGFLHALVYDESQGVRDLDRLLARASGLIASVERGEGALGVLLRDPDAARAVRRVAGAAEGLARAVDRAGETDSLLKALVFDPEGKALVADLRETARNFREVTARLARGDGLLGSLTRPGSEDVVKQAAQGLAGLGRLADDLARDPRLGETLADLRAAMANLKAITGRVEAGEGTLGGLITDPTVYENLAAFLEGAQRSLLLRALIRAAIGRGAGAPPKP